MRLLRNILLMVGLLWAVLFRVTPVAGTSIVPQPIPKATVKPVAHAETLSTDVAVFVVQDEDEQAHPTVNQDLLPVWPTDWVALLLALLMALPRLMSPARIAFSFSRPYYLLYGSLRIPLP